VILDTIAAATRRRVAQAQAAVPLEIIRDAAQDKAARGASPEQGPGFAEALAAPGIAIIGEVKRASPSQGLIAPDFPYLRIAQEYEEAGAAAISVLTEPEFFLGSDTYLQEIAAAAHIPLLRKDFILDPYQLYEAKVLGASAVLLICALLDTRTLEQYLALAERLGLACLTEVHRAEEVLSALDAGARIIGINNRDLSTFRVDRGITSRLRRLIPPEVGTVSESGFQSAGDIRVLAELGIDGVLIGEALMRATDKKHYLAELKGGGRI
jgi:indole-3-glycerol phosphate synthase